MSNIDTDNEITLKTPIQQWAYEYKEFLEILKILLQTNVTYRKRVVLVEFIFEVKLDRAEPEIFIPRNKNILACVLEGSKKECGNDERSTSVKKIWERLFSIFNNPTDPSTKPIELKRINGKMLENFSGPEIPSNFTTLKWVVSFVDRLTQDFFTDNRSLKKLRLGLNDDPVEAAFDALEIPTERSDIEPTLNHKNRMNMSLVNSYSGELVKTTERLREIENKLSEVEDDRDGLRERLRSTQDELKAVKEHSSLLDAKWARSVYKVNDRIQGDLRASRLGSHNEFLLNKLQGIINGPPNDEVIVECRSIPITTRTLQRLKPKAWLNDELVNAYFALLQERDNILSCTYSNWGSSKFMSSFFIEKLLFEDKVFNYLNVERWTMTYNIFEMKKIYFPINIENYHWTLAIIDIIRKEIRYHDSHFKETNDEKTKVLHKKHMDVVYALKEWVVCEGKKHNVKVDVNEWELTHMGTSIPQQNNGYDCGLFVIAYADYELDNLGFSFDQDVVSFFRLKVGIDILRRTVVYPLYR